MMNEAMNDNLKYPPLILIVDDDTDMRRVMELTLQSRGWRVDQAANGANALVKINASKPDLIVIDLMMPGMSGLDVLRELKADDSICTIPVIMLTGLSEKEKIKEALVSGTDYYIVKPFDFQDLLSKINDTLQNTNR